MTEHTYAPSTPGFLKLEHEFGIDVGDKDLTMDNLSNVVQIAI